jgi:hypothetical protein
MKATANPAALACKQAVLVKYAGTKREYLRPLIMPVAPWCDTHDEPMLMCGLRKRIRELEAKLNQSRSTREGFLIARAERAEAELAKANGLLNLDGHSLRASIARAERAEARELEDE